MNIIHPLNSKVLTFDDDKGGEINLKSGIDWLVHKRDMNFEATGKILNIWIYPDSG
jgi:hypothetical protein